MTKKEVVEKNIGMTFDFLRYLVDHPEMVENIPNGSVIEFVDKDITVTEAPLRAKKEKAVSFQVEHTFKRIKSAPHPSHSAL